MKDYARIRPVRKKRRRKTINTFSFSSLIQPFFAKGPLPIIGALAAIAIIGIISVFWITRNLPTPDSILSKAEYSTTILDRNGKIIYQVYKDKNIVPITYNNLPEHLIQATIAIEDKDFFKHQGFSLQGIFRAFLRNIFFGKREGGSTITQQLIKNTLLTSEQKIERKIKEFILAVELERRYSKKQILEMYFNQTPYGGSSWGIGSAAKYYFNKKPSDLTLLESVILAGLPQSPSKYSPYIGKKGAYIERAKQVLRRMREDKYITKDTEKKLAGRLENVRFAKRNESIPAAHFVFYIKKQLDKLVGNELLYKKGLVIKTTLDLKLQKQAEKIVKQEIKKAQPLDISNGAVVVLNSKTGEILAMVGSVDYNNKKFGKFNTATALRQPGSTLKPFTYALAFESNYTPSSVLMDVKTEFTSGESDASKPYIPKDYDGKYRGPVQMRFALGSSLNIPAVKTLALVGIKNFMQKVYDAGLTTLEPTDENLGRFGLSITLGGGEVRLIDLVSAYTTFANKGTAVRPIAIKEVRNYNNKLIYKPPKPERKKIFDYETTFLISHILSDNNARLLTFGQYNNLVIPGKTVAAKTGTTDDLRDNWTIGFTKNIVAGVWVGNNDNSKMNKNLASGLSGAAPIYNRIMTWALNNGYEDGIQKKPDDIEAVEIDSLFGGLPYENMPKRVEYFKKGTEPTEQSNYYKILKISKSTGKLANPIEIENGDYEEKLFYVVKESDPLSADGVNRWQLSIDDWARQQDDEKWKPPTEISENSQDNISINFEEPNNLAEINSNTVNIKVRVISGKELEYIKLYIDNNEELSTKDSVISITKDLSNGIHTITIEAKNIDGKENKKEIKIGIFENPSPDTPTEKPTPTI